MHLFSGSIFTVFIASQISWTTVMAVQTSTRRQPEPRRLIPKADAVRTKYPEPPENNSDN